MSDYVYDIVPAIPRWSTGAQHTNSNAVPVPTKVAIHSYTSTPPGLHHPRQSLPDDVMARRPSLPPPRRPSSNSESKISSPKHTGAALVKGGGFPPVDRKLTGTAPLHKCSSAVSVESTELSLSAFVDKYASCFPLRVNVTKGFYGISDQTAITTGDHYNFHFLKHTMVVTATEAMKEYSIPIESSLKVALLYETTNIEDAEKGIVFETCADLLNAKVQPRVLATCRQFNGRSMESSVESGEILVFVGWKVEGVTAGNNLASKGNRQLKFHSVTKNSYKILPESCSCGFTTSPRATGAPLSSLCLQKEWLPVKALVCPCNDKEHTAGILVELNNAVLNFTALREETTVVATGADGNPSEALEVIELPKELNIEVELIHIKETEMHDLLENTQNRYDSFSPDSVIHYAHKPTSKVYDIQCALYKTVVGVRTEFQSLLIKPSVLGQRQSGFVNGSKTDIDDLSPLYGIHASSSSVDTPYASSEFPSSVCDKQYSTQPVEVLKRPDTLLFSRVSPNASNCPANLAKSHVTSIESHANIVTSRSPKKPENLSGKCMTVPVCSDDLEEYITMMSSCTTVSQPPLDLQRRITGIEQNCKEYKANVQEISKKLSEDIAKLSDTVIEIKNQCSRLQEEINRMKVSSENQYSVPNQPGPRLKGNLNGHLNYCTSPPSVGDSFPPDAKVDEHNREFLMSMDVDKVLKLLHSMSLSQYEEAFLREQINGELLCECDENVLQNDLGVASKLHRMRLMKVITGRHSAKSLVDGI